VRYADGCQLAKDLRTVESQLEASTQPPPPAGALSAPTEQSFADTSPPTLTDPRHNSLS